jgi:bifunctional non-homologous end joining protein LigD
VSFVVHGLFCSARKLTHYLLLNPGAALGEKCILRCARFQGTMPAGANAAMDSTIEVQGKQLKLSNLEKVLYPATGFTKQQVIDYYVRIAPAMVPHLAGRPLTRKRYPNGVDEEFFYEKNAPQHRPDWVKTAPIWSGRNRRTIHYILADDLATLVWLANLAAIELHPSLALAEDLTCPTMMVFDLDPGPPANIVQCCQVGMWLREIFEHFGLQSFPKTSGSKGLQIYVPLNTPTNYESTKTFSHALAQLLEHEHPEMVVSDMKKQLRTGKVFVDWSQNDEHKTTIGVYSLRAREQPTVSTPVTWEEAERALKKKDASLLVFEAKQVVARVDKLGDLFAPVLELKQRLPDLKGSAAVAAAPPGISIAAQAEEEAEDVEHRMAKKGGKRLQARKPKRKV